MPLVGNIRDFGLSDFLYLVDRGYKTGCLYLNRPSEKAILFFDKGKLIYASRTEGERMADLLVRLGIVNQQQIAQVQHSTNDSKMLTQALTDENIISQDELQRALQTHVEEEVYGLFGWPDGEFRFEHGQKPEPDGPIMPSVVPVEHPRLSSS